jgi:hypothetical protein
MNLLKSLASWPESHPSRLVYCQCGDNIHNVKKLNGFQYEEERSKGRGTNVVGQITPGPPKWTRFVSRR